MLVLETEFLALRVGPGEKFAFIAAHCLEFRVEKMCEVLGVSRSGFYTWCISRGSTTGDHTGRTGSTLNDNWPRRALTKTPYESAEAP